MFVVISPIFVADTRIIFRYNVVAPIMSHELPYNHFE